MTSWYGMPSVELAAGDLRVVVVPELGGKIASLRLAGREWLAQPDRELSPVSYGDSYRDADLSGWDELLPTIEACVLPSGVALPDHGEVWTQAWQVQWASERDLISEVSGRVLPYHLRRQISLVPPTTDEATGTIAAAVRLDYQIRVTGTSPVPLLWAAHPQFVVSAKTRLTMPSHVDGVWQVSPRNARLPWPADGQGVLDGVETGEACRLYLPTRVRAGWCCLEDPDGSSLRLEWDPEVVPYLGIAIDNGRYSREPVVSILPTTGHYDSLERAERDGRVCLVSPARPLQFALTVRLQAR